MKVYADNETDSFALRRIETALREYAPKTIEFVNKKEEADLVIYYLWGRLEHKKIDIERITSLGKKYAAVQVCVKSTRNPNTTDWLPIWKNAELVWSYFDLPAYCKEDGNPANFKFYYAPLGVDKAFKKYPVKKEYVIASSGLGYLIESVRECILAAGGVGKKVFHIGPVITSHTNVDYSNGMNDVDLAKKYSACEFVSGLRRKEGFEFPVVEGLVCGARPIVFDRPDCHHWFDGFAVFIPENGRDGIVESLGKIFRKEAKPVTSAEIKKAKNKFNWQKIIEGFWERI